MKKILELIQGGYEVLFSNNGNDLHIRLMKKKTRSHWTETIPAKEAKTEGLVEGYLDAAVEAIEKAEADITPKRTSYDISAETREAMDKLKNNK